MYSLTEREKTILQMRSSGKTLKEVGEFFGISRERVRQIEDRMRMNGFIPVLNIESSDTKKILNRATRKKPGPKKTVYRYKGLRNRAKPWKRAEAVRFRLNPTASEAILWERLRAKRLGFRFHRQSIILGWIVDFYCPKRKLVVELDGKYHRQRYWRDKIRDKNLLERGIKTLRIQSWRVIQDPDAAVQKIKKAINRADVI